MDSNRRPRILIVDDEELNLKIIAGMLRGQDYDLETAKDGPEALEKVKQFTPDMIFLDIMMPEIDGIEMCKILRQEPMTRHIPIVLITAISDSTLRSRCLDSGASAYVTKPVSRAELLGIAERILNEKTSISR